MFSSPIAAGYRRKAPADRRIIGGLTAIPLAPRVNQTLFKCQPTLDTLLDPRLLAKAKIDALVELKAFIDAKLSNTFSPPPVAAGAAYESRVLNGVWAVAPYLHNGSVPNLWELMKPAKDRKSSFMVGSRIFDPKNVGYAVDESPFKTGAFLADPANANGNGNGGHEFGVGLTDDERWAIIGYMKTF